MNFEEKLVYCRLNSVKSLQPHFHAGILDFCKSRFWSFSKISIFSKKCLFETKKRSLSKGTCYFLIFHGLKFPIRPPAKQKSNKFGNSDNHGYKYLAILHIFINFQEQLRILSADFSTTKDVIARIRVFPRSLGSRLLENREIDFFNLRPKTLSPKSKSNL